MDPFFYSKNGVISGQFHFELKLDSKNVAGQDFISTFLLSSTRFQSLVLHIIENYVQSNYTVWIYRRIIHCLVEAAGKDPVPSDQLLVRTSPAISVRMPGVC